MIDVQTEARCKDCGRPIVRIPGRRPREFCNVTCRQRYHRKRNQPQGEAAHPQVSGSALNEARGTIDILNVQVRSLQSQVERLKQQIDTIRDVESLWTQDTRDYAFKSWLTKHAYHASRPGCKKLLDPAMGFSPRGSRGKYQDEMRKAYFTGDEKGDVWDAWRDMLRDVHLQSYYATNRDKS